MYCIYDTAKVGLGWGRKCWIHTDTIIIIGAAQLSG